MDLEPVTTESRLAALELEAAARNLVGAYADAVDGHDQEALASMFADDMELTASGRRHVGLAAVLAFYRSAAESDPTPRRHFISDTRVRSSGTDAIEATSSFIYTAGTGGRSIIGWGRYTDRFVRRDGAVRFVSKHIEVEFRGPVDQGWAEPT